MDGDNWYVYCANNPVMFVDKSGLSLTLSEITSKGDSLFKILQHLTDDTLDVDLKTGTVSYTEGTNISRNVATNLVRDIINNNINCDMVTFSEQNGKTSWYYDSDSNKTNIKVSINPDFIPNTWTYVDGEGYDERTCPSFIVMGHELVHAMHVMTGAVENSSEQGYYLGGPEPGKTLLRSEKLEELNTTGIDYFKIKNGNWNNATKVEASKNYYSENALRLEYDNVHKNDNDYAKLGRRASY